MSGVLSAHGAATVADDAEAAAFAELYACAPPALQSRLGLRVERIADATLLLAPGLPESMFNRAIGLGLRQEAGAAQVDAIVQAYRAAGCPTWWLHWNPHSTPESLPAMLPSMGFTQPARRSWAKVLHGPEPAPKIPTDLHIAPATASQLGEVIRAIVTAFEMPPFMADWLAALHGQPHWRVYAVTDGALVVGGGCLYVSGELAWLGMGAVLPSHRRRGGQGALMARRIADAIEAGALHVVTETGEPIADEPNPSLANMKRCGFVTVASRLNFAGPAQ
ncbi:hypothetical protein [Ramlibacter sp. WS9]|uniref:hypothetical protein n=1 Tax=Ramlibacter sp. WS9 TaxID=1882741 RepID=UPI00114411D1|nr:hypothetical protein [Ramlibacter sp. WS9]ROZ72747.1 hypothetical protein EEB15_18715 [Ramlibacter sp. WS9]